MLENLNVGQKAVVIGTRYNPQLGTYLTGPFVVTIRRVNKASYSVAYDDSIQASTCPANFSFSGRANGKDDCIYGSTSYVLHTFGSAISEIEGFANKEDPGSLLAEKYHRNANFLRVMSEALDR